MATRSVATVFGGSGFVGRYVVKRLAEADHIVRVAGRNTEAAKQLMTGARVGQVVPLAVSLTNEAAVQRAVEGADLVVNLVGILTESRDGDFMRVQGEGAGRIARAAAAARVGRTVHVSAIGASHDSPSAYARSKAAGEDAVRALMRRCLLAAAREPHGLTTGLRAWSPGPEWAHGGSAAGRGRRRAAGRRRR